MPARINNRQPAAIDLPAELRDLTLLHSSFLTALSLHYAHHGTSTPVDLRLLTPTIARIWGRRAVTLDDIQTCLGILSQTPHNHFLLFQYETGRVCLELSAALQEQTRTGILTRPLDENTLNAAFTKSLAQLWKDWLATQADEEPERPTKKTRRAKPTTRRAGPNTTAFLSSLPKLDVTVRTSNSLTSALHAKGRARLESLKSSIAEGRVSQSPGKRKRGSHTATPREETPTPTPATQPPPPQPAAAADATLEKSTAQLRSLSLLDRILAKQAHAASLPPAPTPAQKARAAALHRGPEILDLLVFLASQKAGLRASFSLHGLVQSIRTSVRSPIAPEEAVMCVELLAREVVPGFVGLVEVGGPGGVRSVVVNKGGRPRDLRAVWRGVGVVV